MQQSDISGNRISSEKRKSISLHQRVFFGVIAALFFTFYPFRDGWAWSPPADFNCSKYMSFAMGENGRRSASINPPGEPDDTYWRPGQSFCERYVRYSFMYGGGGSRAEYGGGFATAYDHWIWIRTRGGRKDWANMQPGDMIFFGPTATNYAGHIGIYIGGGKYISAQGITKSIGILSINVPSNKVGFVSMGCGGTSVPPPPPPSDDDEPGDTGTICNTTDDDAPLTGSFAYDVCQIHNLQEQLTCPIP